MDRTVLPGNPAGEAADGVVDAVDPASMVLSQGSRVNKDNRDFPRRVDSRGRGGKAVDLEAVVLTGKNSAANITDQ
ncbi:MAG: hypothetical protein ACM3JB_22305 [Acidobacteriaceae bacterium]